MSTLRPFLELWRDPVVARSTKTSAFVLDSLLGQQPATLHASVPHRDLARLGGLTRLLPTALFRRVALRGADRKVRRFEMLLAELGCLGRDSVFEDTPAYLRGCGVRCALAPGSRSTSPSWPKAKSGNWRRTKC